MVLLKENSELSSKVEEDEEDIENLTQKNRSLMAQVKCLIFCLTRQHEYQHTLTALYKRFRSAGGNLIIVKRL